MNVSDKKIAIIDIETSGIFCGEDGNEPASILRVDGTKIDRGEIVENFSSLVASDKYIPKHIEEITGINNLMLNGAPNVKTVLKNLKEFTSGYEVYARNSKFDNKFLTYYGNKFEEEVNLAKADDSDEISVFINYGAGVRERLKETKDLETLTLAKMIIEVKI